MSERKSRSGRARDLEEIQRAFKETQRAFEAAARSRPALVSGSKNVTRLAAQARKHLSGLQDMVRGTHQRLVSVGAYLRDHESEIKALLDHLEAANRNFKNAKLLPEGHPHRKFWEEIGHSSLERYIVKWCPRLPYIKPPPARRGRPKGAGPVISDKPLFQKLDDLVTAGSMKPTTAAKALLRKRGVPPDPPEVLKYRADYAVKLLKKRGENQPKLKTRKKSRRI